MRLLAKKFAPAFLTVALLSLAQGPSGSPQEKPSQEERRGSKASSLDDRQADREKWFLRGRTTADGRIAPQLRLRAHQQKMQMRRSRKADFAARAAANLAAPFTATLWRSLGPAPLFSDATTPAHTGGDEDFGPVSGRATSVVIDPNDPSGNTVYAGGAFGGVWKSTNAANVNPAAVAWTPLLDNQPTSAVGAIAVQPTNGNVIIVGTGEANNSADSYYGLGILRSADAGATWTLISSTDNGAHSFHGLAFSKIAFSTDRPNLVVAGAAAAIVGELDGAVTNSATRGIYVSQDAGITWTLANVTDNGTRIAPGSVTSVVYNAAMKQFYAAIRFHGFYTSSDGANWTRLANQPILFLNAQNCPANPASTVCPILRGEITVVPGRNEMYTWLIDFNDLNQGIFKTSDAGKTWTTINDAGIEGCGDFVGCSTDQGAYNLGLKAVPNGTGTDLYAVAINIFKCSISDTNPTCGQTSSFLNLTHVYGCTPLSSLSHVHPDQHALDAIVTNKQALMYFANDGGVYRALDGFGLTSGQCTQAPNAFDSLNANLGPMAQFVSMSLDPSDPSTILGGTQDNGAPATNSAITGGNWVNTNAGDVGYSAINPNNAGEWFTSNSGVTIQRCTNGINCLAQDFNFVVTPNNVGNDNGAFYTPYILDPQNTSALIVGTCHVWRGPSDGSASALLQLSPNFEAGLTAPDTSCTGGETNLVRSLAAGGPSDANGSLVIYAGTDGFPNSKVPGGHLFVTTNASATPPLWSDHTGTINPKNFPISGIFIDPSDSTGATAYVTIMGFGVSHVWKTTTAGTAWTDFTANLPDAPANSILLDAAAGTVYVGTDVGVFVSLATAPFWVEVGPSSGSTGFLPSVAVTSLRLFEANGQRLIRASTYGRGIWETLPVTLSADFTLLGDSSTPSISAGATATYSLNVMPATGVLLDTVALSCSGNPALTTCSLSPASIAAGSSTTPVKLSILTTAPVNSALLSRSGLSPSGDFYYAALLPFSGIPLIFGGVFLFKGKRKVATLFSTLGLVVILCIFLGGCGGSGQTPPPAPQPGTASGTYTITVKAASSTVVHTTQVTLIVK